MSSSNTDTATYRLERESLDLRFRSATLTGREWLSEHYVRVRVEGEELAGFGSTGHDDHIRIFLPDERPDTVDELRQAPSREFTPLAWGTTAAGSPYLDLEFALHGDEGVASVWAQRAPLGAFCGVGGPRGALRVEGEPDGWLLAGDETAIPQIRRYAQLIPEDAPALILVEVRGAAHQLKIDAPVPVEFVNRGGAFPGTALADALGQMDEDDRPGEDPFVFVAAEQAIVKPARALVVDRWGLDLDRRVIKGYWKSGDTEYHAAH
ncbi:siderophore-interacting protein [Microbacterium excoecariae]|uniref:siderophore-interacting protein n=1 Tax=Microbacterium excoecariae TaxID=2715210 RepID=UPI001408C3E7|nr:siderophore-interacting protein [Microbacterium excoecariae]NHI16319.1 siderophore-interacting protein [Microbacterium excoecariae]